MKNIIIETFNSKRWTSVFDLWHRLGWCAVTDVSKKPATITFRVNAEEHRGNHLLEHTIYPSLLPWEV